MSHHLTRIVRRLREEPWAIHPDTFASIIEVVDRRVAGVRLTPAEIEARIGPDAGRRVPKPAPGSIAVLPLHGPLVYRGAQAEQFSGPALTSTERWGRAFRGAMADDAIGAIVIDVDSPGGEAYGLEELADQIYASRGQGKPIVAVANPWAASAAYFIASQADELVVTPSGEVGSIGVIAYHDDISAAAEQEGIKRTFVTSARRKSEGNPFEPLSEEGRAYLQDLVDRYDADFVRAVSRGRGVPQATVRSASWGEGRMVGAAEAVAAGMADREATLEDTIERLRARQPKPKKNRAAGMDRRRIQVALARRR